MKTEYEANQEMRGTIDQLINRGMRVNGVCIDKAMLSVLIRCGIGKHVGEGNKPARGKTPKVYEFVESNELNISVKYKE